MCVDFAKAALAAGNAVVATGRNVDAVSTMGFEFKTAYAADKFGLEGWMEALAPEVSSFGVYTTSSIARI
jgi:hypothetical protein